MDTTRWLIAGGALLLAFGVALVLLVLFVLSPGLFFRLLSALGVLLTLVSVTAMLRSAHKAKTVSIRAQVLAMAISLLSVGVFAAFLGAHAGVLVWLLAPLFGGFVGVAWSFTTRLALEDGAVRRQGGVLYIALWAFLLVAQQCVAVVLGRVPAFGMGLLLFGTGVVLGQSAMLILRTALLRSTAS